MLYKSGMLLDVNGYFLNTIWNKVTADAHISLFLPLNVVP